MPQGFKIGDGFLEIHGEANRAQLTKEGRAAGKVAGDAAEAEGERHKSTFFDAIFKPNRSVLMALRTGIPGALGSPLGATALGLGTLFAGSFAAAVLSFGIPAAVGGAFIGISAFALRENERIVNGFNSMTERIGDVLRTAAQPMVEPLVQSMSMISNSAERMSPTLYSIFSTLSRAVEPLTAGIIGFVENMLMAIERSMPGFVQIINSVSDSLPGLGTAFGNMFETIADNADVISKVVPQAFGVVTTVMGFVSGAVEVLTDVFRGFGVVGSGVFEVIFRMIGVLTSLRVGLALFRGLTGIGAAVLGPIRTGIVGIGTAAPAAATGVSRFSRAMSGLRRAGGIAGGLFLVGQAISAISKAGPSGARGVEATTSALLDLKDGTLSAEESTRILDGLFSDLQNNFIVGGEGVQDFGAALDRVLSPSNAQRYSDFANEVFTLGMGSGSKELDNAREAIGNMDQALSQLVSGGNADAAAQAFEQVANHAEEQGYSVEEVMALFPQYEEALAGAKNENELAAPAVKENADAHQALKDIVGILPEHLQEEADALQEITDAAFEASDKLLGLRAAHRDVQTAIDDANETIDENGETLDINTEKGRANQEAIDGIAEAVLAETQALIDNKAPLEDIQAKLDEGGRAFRDAATDAGMTEEAANQLWRELTKVPGDYVAQLKLEKEQEAKQKTQALNYLLGQFDNPRNATLGVMGEKPATNAIKRPISWLDKFRQGAVGPLKVANEKPATNSIRRPQNHLNTFKRGATAPLKSKGGEIVRREVASRQGQLNTYGRGATAPLRTNGSTSVGRQIGNRQGQLNKFGRGATAGLRTQGSSYVSRVIGGRQGQLNTFGRGATASIRARDYASGVLSTIVGILGSIFSKTITVTTVYKSVGGPIPKGGRAMGGPVHSAGYYDVGELGRERVFLPAGAYVANAFDTRKMDDGKYPYEPVRSVPDSAPSKEQSNFGDVYVNISAKDLAEFKTATEFFNTIRQTARAGVRTP